VSTDSHVAVLKDLCRERCVLTAIPLSSPHPAAVRAVEASLDTLLVEVLDPRPSSLRAMGALSCHTLVYITSKSALILLGRVIGEPNAKRLPVRTTYTIDSAVMRAQARQAYRVPVEVSAGLEAVIRTEDDSRYGMIVHNISLGGLAGEVISAQHAELSIKDRIQVALRCGGLHILVDGEIRRKEGDIFGVLFRDSWRRGELEPPSEIREIVRIAETAWIRAKGV